MGTDDAPNDWKIKGCTMCAKLNVAPAVKNHVLARFNERGLTSTDYEAWKEIIEFDLGSDLGKKLRIVHDGKDFFHEHSSVMRSGSRAFRVAWEIDWIRSTDDLHLLGVHITLLPPNVHAASGG